MVITLVNAYCALKWLRDRVGADRKHDRDCSGRGLRCERRGSAADRDDHGHLPLDEIGSQRRQSIVMAVGPAIFDRNVLALDIATFAQAPTGMPPYSMQRPQAIDYREFRSPTFRPAPRAP
jgi:hypothetical protein